MNPRGAGAVSGLWSISQANINIAALLAGSWAALGSSAESRAAPSASSC